MDPDSSGDNQLNKKNGKAVKEHNRDTLSRISTPRAIHAPSHGNNAPVCDPAPKSIAEVPRYYVARYQQFIQRNRVILRLVEDSLSRLVLYAPSRFVSHDMDDDVDGGSHSNSKILPETLYAMINLWSLLNDAIYHGFGNGNGLTVGCLKESRVGGTIPDHDSSGAGPPKTAIDLVIQTLQSILSTVECMAPALEVSAYVKSRRGRKKLSRTPLSSSETHGYSKSEENQSSHGKGQHDHWGDYSALGLSATKIERIKFLCRLGILGINYWKQYRVMKSCQQEGLCQTDALSSMGILQYGGLLEPGEKGVSILRENERVQKLLYVGKRTGRQIYYTANNRDMALNAGAKCERQHRRGRHKGGDRQQRQSQQKQMFESTTSKLGCIVIGELLHVYRPLYYIQSCLRHNTQGRKKDRALMLKSWIISLCMDVLSQKLIVTGKTVRVHQRNRSQCKDIDTSSESTKDELYRRKMQWTIYLLRAPIWDLITRPLSEHVSGAASHIPLIGPPLVRYVMDVLYYWQKWHFMQE